MWVLVGSYAALLALMGVVHEAGHYWVLRHYLRRAGVWRVRLFWRAGSLRVGEPWQYSYLGPREYRRVLMAGVLGGFVVVPWAPVWSWGFLLVPYVVACRHDLKQLRQAA